MKTPTVLFVGSSGAGKTNYLFRLWLALRDDKHRAIQRNGNPEELSYLTAGVSQQLDGRFARHTAMAVRERIVIPLLVNGSNASLTIPDRPGEDWRRFYERRRFPADWIDLIAPATSCLVFLPSTGTDQPHDWMAIQRFQGTAANLRKELDMRDAPPPTQTVVVDTIQLLVEQFRRGAGSARPPRIGIIVSAWDALPPEEQAAGPMEHLRVEHKLLHDFITTNRAELAIEAFGVTLYGGDLNDEGFKATFGDQHPRELGAVWHRLGGDLQQSDDLALPVAWALHAAP